MQSELTHLIKMMNQISDNQPRNLSTESAAENVASHINRFWAKPMRKKILDLNEDQKEQLTPIAQIALNSIHPPAQ